MNILEELQKLNVVGQFLDWIRTTDGFNTEQVADAAQISRQHLRDIETRQSRSPRRWLP